MAETAPVLGIIDTQRGLMPVEEGIRLGSEGFGDMPVPDGQGIIAPLNRMVMAYRTLGYPVFTTQDWHQPVTPHFSETPDYELTWPPHCIAGTPGAELHPEIILQDEMTRFYKGARRITSPEEDDSYNACFAVEPKTNVPLYSWLHRNRFNRVTLAGLALDTCISKTALELRRMMDKTIGKQDGSVTVIADAVRSLDSKNTAAAIGSLRANGVSVVPADWHLLRL